MRPAPVEIRKHNHRKSHNTGKDGGSAKDVDDDLCDCITGISQSQIAKNPVSNN